MGVISASGAERWTIPGSAHRLPTGSVRIGSVDPDESRSVMVVLPRRREAFAGDAAGDWDTEAIVRRIATMCGLRVTGDGAREHRLRLAGPSNLLLEAFEADVARYWHPAIREFRGRVGELSVPSLATGAVLGVFGFDERPATESRLWSRAARGETAAVIERCGFPAGATGAGETIVIVAPAGGFRRRDLLRVMRDHDAGPPSRVTPVTPWRDGPRPTGSPAAIATSLAVQVACVVAPGARVVVYLSTNTASGVLDAVMTALHEHAPSVLLIDGAGLEGSWTGQALAALDEAMRDAARRGVTVLAVCAGNAYPGASPWVTACGAAGGDPAGADLVLRDAPWPVIVRGAELVVGGDAAVAALCAGAAALLNEAAGTRLGFLNPRLTGRAAGGDLDVSELVAVMGATPP